jgi:hypothetical protein
MEENDMTKRNSIDEKKELSESGELFLICDHELDKLEQDAANLAIRASLLSRLSKAAKATTIVLGAVIATSGTAATIWGDDSVGVLLFFTLCGVTVAAVSGLDAAFKLETRSNSRRLLAADVSAKISYLRLKKNGLKAREKSRRPGDGKRLAKLTGEAQKLLTELSKYIISYQKQAADAGVNLQYERLRGESESKPPAWQFWRR